jgi:hypothetical protein
MDFSKPALHPALDIGSEQMAAVDAQFSSIAQARRSATRATAADVSGTNKLVIPLTTVSLNTNFDAFIDIFFAGSPPDYSLPLLLDSGNSTLIVPSWEDIAALPNSANNYKVLGTATEPWGCPANVVLGPICIVVYIAPNQPIVHQIDNCIFYACTGISPKTKSLTSNFGAGCLSPWKDTPLPGVTMQAPLSYSQYPIAEFNFEAASNILSLTNEPRITTGSNLNLYLTIPRGYSTFSIIQNLDWMCLIPKQLGIGSVDTLWPGSIGRSPIAMVDTGGGPVNLCDPHNLIVNTHWPDPKTNPSWWSPFAPFNCRSIAATIGIELGDEAGSFRYKIDPSLLPRPDQQLTLVMCTENKFMFGNYGMNIGGLSVLFVQVVVDYADARVGLRLKQNTGEVG